MRELHGVLIWAHKLLTGRGQELLIAGAQVPVQRLFALTGANNYLNVE